MNRGHERGDERLDRILESLQQVNVNLESLRVSLTMLSEQGMDHEERLRDVEKWRHNMVPYVAGMTFLLGCVLQLALGMWWGRGR